jgi:hypothetical protein
MSEPMRRDIDALLNDREGMDAAFRCTVILTLQTHKREGNSIAVWQAGKLIGLKPEDIPEPLRAL